MDERKIWGVIKWDSSGRRAEGLSEPSVDHPMLASENQEGAA